MIATCSKCGSGAVGHENRALLDVDIVMHRPVHALVQLAVVHSELVEASERALINNIRGAIVSNKKTAAHKVLKKTHQGQELKTWTFSVPAGCQQLSRHVGRHAPPKGAVGRREYAVDSDNQDAIEDECLISPPVGVPPIPEVHWR